MSAAAGHRLVLIGGLHRSGTTQLHTTLGTHREVAGMSGTGAPHDEGQHLQDVYPTARSHGGPGRFALDPAAHLTETSPLATPESAARLLEQWSAHWDTSRPVLSEKSPPNLIRMRFLQHLFPEARFVVLVRHPVVITLATQKLATTFWMRRTGRRASLDATARHWFAAHRLLLEDLPHVRHVHVLRWEDLCADPAGALDAVADFVGIDRAFTLPDLDADSDGRYVERWDALQDRARPGRDLTRLRTTLAAHRDVAARFGYDLDDPTRLGALDL